MLCPGPPTSTDPDPRTLVLPLNKQALPLDSAPTAVADARRWVLTVCQELQRDDLLDCAELGVSELVTNALLHGVPPISVGVRGTREHPRIEVRDGSNRLPPEPAGLPEDVSEIDLDDIELDDVDDLLTTYGRGLSIVSMAATTWGATLEPNGKTVWFEPASTFREDAPADAVIDVKATRSSRFTPLPDARPVRLQNIDVRLALGALNQYYSLRRELRLLALAHGSAYPLAKDLSQMFSTFERQFPPGTTDHLGDALKNGINHAELVVQASPQSAQIFTTMLEMFELADAFCHAQRLLSLARTPEQKQFQEWLFAELVHQAAGGEPQPWSGVAEETATGLRAVDGQGA